MNRQQARPIHRCWPFPGEPCELCEAQRNQPIDWPEVIVSAALLGFVLVGLTLTVLWWPV